MDANATEAVAVEEQTPAPVQQVNENAAANEPDDDFEVEGFEGDEIEGLDPDPSEDEIEYEGKKYKVAKELKEAFLRNADYTRKTQEVAEQRRAIEAERQRVSQMAQATEAELEKRAELTAARKTLEQYEQVDWARLEQDDFIGAQQHFRQYQMLKDQAQRLSGEIEGLQHQRLAETQQETAKRIASSREEASKTLKGWSTEREEKAFSWAVNDLGIPAPLLVQNLTPAVYKGIYMAWLGHQVMNRPAKPQAAPAQSAPQETEPQTAQITRLAGKNGAAPRGLHDNLSIDEWTKRRNEQVKRQG